MDIALIQIGLAIFSLLGVLHGVYTLRDLRNPRYFAPRDRKLVKVLETAGMGITREQDNFWKAYMGFHLSHSLGILIFSLTYLALSFIMPELLFHPALMSLQVGTGALYMILSKKYWFSKPFVGSGLALLFFILGFGIHFSQVIS